MLNWLEGPPCRQIPKRESRKNQPRSRNMSRNRLGAGFNGTRTDVHPPCFAGISHLNRLPSQVTAPYNAGER